MAPYISSDTTVLLRGTDGGLRLGIFWRLGTNPALHLAWGIAGDVPIALLGIDIAGTVYLGAGKLLNIPDLELLINGIADEVQFTLSGVDPDFVANLSVSAPSVLNALCTVGFAPLDVRYQPLTPIIPVWSGLGDYWAQNRVPSSDPTKPAACSITLAARTGDTARSRPSLETFTMAAQQLLYPTDTFFSQIAKYNNQYLVSWPQF